MQVNNSLFDSFLSQKKIYPSFLGKMGCYLNPQAQKQSDTFEKEFDELLNSNQPVMGGFDYLVCSIFPDLNYLLKDINDCKNPDIIKNQPFIFCKSNFNSSEPQTVIYLNQNRIENIKKNSADPKTELKAYAKRIADVLARKNELNFIAKIVDDCIYQCSQLKDFSITKIDELYKKIIQKYNLDIDFETVDKTKDVSMVGNHCTVLNRFLNDDIKAKIGINVSEPIESIKSGVSHEFHHVLNNNSVEFNQLFTKKYLKSDQIPECDKLELHFIQIHTENPFFLKEKTAYRNAVYNELLKTVFVNDKATSLEKINVMIKCLEQDVRDEAFAYSKTVQPSNFIPIGKYFNDFYNYLLSVKYDEEKRLKIVNHPL